MNSGGLGGTQGDFEVEYIALERTRSRLARASESRRSLKASSARAMATFSRASCAIIALGDRIEHQAGNFPARGIALLAAKRAMAFV